MFDGFGYQYVRRTKINTGFKCNLRCRFCYYYDKISKFDEDFNNIKRQLDIAKKNGIVMIDFSGGESTIHKDFLRMVKYAKKLGFETICTLTNGMAFANIDYLKRAKDAGLNEILFSLHGVDEKNHETITQVKGSHKRMMQAIKNAKRLGIKFRINVTVNKLNCKGLVKQAKVLRSLKPFQVNYIVFNEWRYGEEVANTLGEKYSIMAPEIMKAIDHLKGVESINVRYIPFCFMKGYEKYVTGHHNVMYDNYEWFPKIRAQFECNSKWHWYKVVAYTILKFKSLSITKNITRLYEKDYAKPEKCNKCRLRDICDGFTKTYLQINGGSEVKPYPLKDGYIKDPILFRKTSRLPIIKNGITIIEANDVVRGAAYSRNMQIENAKTDILLIKDKDVDVSAKVLKKMKGALKGADIVYPKVLNNILGKKYFEGTPLRSSTCFMVRKSILTKHNLLFDEKYFIYGEDDDFFIRCNLAGLKVKMIKDLVKHTHIPTQFYLKWRFYLSLRNYVYSLRKWRKLPKETRDLFKYPTWRGFLGRIRYLFITTKNPITILRAIVEGMRM